MYNVGNKTFREDRTIELDYNGGHQNDTNQLITKNWSSIRSKAWYHKYSNVYNVRIANNDLVETLSGENAESIYAEQSEKFKINASLGYVLINHTNEQLRYWHPSSNRDRLFERPVLISDVSDYNRFIERLRGVDYIERATRNRPDTKWSMHRLTNITFYVYPITDHPIG